MKVSPCLFHPLRRWRDENGVSAEKLSAMVMKAGGRLSPRSVAEIEGGRRFPSYPLAKILVAVSRNSFSIDDLKEWGRGKRSAA
jgi:transcriptional regulator with XRE-family HTH domain